MTNGQAAMTNQSINPNVRKYDLEERTAQFGEEVIDFVQGLSAGSAIRVLASQIIRSATSIGANYMEADEAETKKDFRYKIGLSKKEARETMHWLRMIAKAQPEKKGDCRKLWQEAHELTLIFAKIIRSSSGNL